MWVAVIVADEHGFPEAAMWKGGKAERRHRFNQGGQGRPEPQNRPPDKPTGGCA